jgi:hypothetical protein
MSVLIDRIKPMTARDLDLPAGYTDLLGELKNRATGIPLAELRPGKRVF